MVLRPKLRPDQIGALQLLAAVSVRKAVEAASGVRIGLKWPNDLILSGQKLGGILLEARTVGERVLFAVLGIGLNVNVPKRYLPRNATSISVSTGKALPTEHLLGEIVVTLESDYREVGEPERLAGTWWAHCSHRGKLVKVMRDAETLVGRNTGVGPDGSLLLKTAEGRVEKVVEGSLRILND